LKYTILLGFLLLKLNLLSAQPPSFNFKLLGKQEGLDVEYNAFVYKDSRGLAWISSQSGIYLFDGNELNHLVVKDENEKTLSDQNIQSQFWEDRSGNIWFSTFSAFHMYDRKKGQFKRYQIKGNDGLIDNGYHVFYLEKQESEILWLKAGEHLFTYDINREKEDILPFSTESVRFAVDTTDKGGVQSIIGSKWVNGTGIDYYTKDSAGVWKKLTSLDKLLTKINVSYAVWQNHTTVWLFGSTELFEFDPNKNEIKGRFSPHWLKGFNPRNGVIWGQNDYLIIAGQGNGLLLFDLLEKRFVQNWKADINSSDNQTASDYPKELYVDAEKILWVAHYGRGIEYAISQPYFSKNTAEQTLMRNDNIQFLLEDKHGQVWIHAKNGNITICNLNKKILTPSGYLAPDKDIIKHISIDSSGIIWGVSNHKLYQFDRLSLKPLKVFETKKELISMYHFGNDRKIVVTTNGAFDLLGFSTDYRLLRTPELAHYRDFPFYHFIKGNGQIAFVPYDYRKLLVLENREGSILVRDSFDINADTYSAYQIPDSNIFWLGTERGLMVYNGDDIVEVAVKHLVENSGSGAYSIIGNEQKDIWFSTNTGLFFYYTELGKLTKYTDANGLPSNSFSPYAALQASDGKIWLGTDSGLVVFHPDSVQTDFPVPRVHIEALWVNNVPYDSEYVISETDTLQLGYRENTLAFELRAVGFYQPEDSQLRYRLKGYEEEAVTVENGGFARFTKVPPGDYTLEVIPLNANGQAGETKQMAILIEPPFWQTLWFRITAVISWLFLIVAIVGAFYRLKLKRQRRQLEQQKALAEERDRIAKELHDDMGSSLSSILFLSEDMMLDAEDEGALGGIHRISKLAENSLDNMREIIWAMDSRKNTLEDLSGRLRAFATEFMADNKVALKLDMPRANQQGVLGGEQRRNIYLIAKEALHNAVKHAQPRQVKLSLRLVEQQLILKIQDDGCGFDTHAAETPGGYGLDNMQSRAEAIGGLLKVESAPGNGTEVSLRVPL